MVTRHQDKLFGFFVNVLLVAVGVVAVFPLLFVVSMSLTPYSEVIKHGGFLVWPRAVTLDAYKILFSGSEISRAFAVTLFITIAGTAVNMILTTLMAYPLSRKNLRGRSFLLFIVVFTMLFSGGIIPTYLIVKSIGLLNSVWAMIIPNAVATFNVLVMKSFFEGLPEEIFESARIDGAKEFRILGRIVIPLSVPSVITVGLFYLVSHWNEFFQAIMYITDSKLKPLQVVVRELLMTSQQTEVAVEVTLPTATLQMAAVITASLPVIVVYPFLQKHLTKGMILGSIKG